MKRRLFLVATGLALLTVLGFVLALGVTAPPRHNITDETILQVRVGQTVPELEALFGIAAGNYSRRHQLAFYEPGDGTVVFSGEIPNGEERKLEGWTEWAGDRVGVCVRLGENGVVT